MRNPWSRNLVLFALFEAVEIFILIRAIMSMRWLVIAIGIFGVVFMSAMVGFAIFGWKQYNDHKKKMKALKASFEAYLSGNYKGKMWIDGYKGKEEVDRRL